MAARKPKNAVEVDGITVVIDADYVKSWDGVMQVVEMQRLAKDENATDVDRVFSLLEYYSKAVANLDEVKDALGGNPPIDDVFAILSKALSEGSGKN